MATNGSLDGRRVLITGAARGIGAGSARELARRGAHVSLVGLEPEELEKVAAACGPEATFFEADITDPDALRRAVEGTVDRLGGIDVVMSNAGIGAGGPVRLMDPEAWERVIRINLIGNYRTVHACLPHVIESRGYVLVIASAAAIAHGPLMSAYCASKAGIEAFADSLRVEVKHHGVDVGVGYFSWIDTDMVTGGDEHPFFKRMRAQLPGPAGRTYPLSTAVGAVVKGVESRARWVTAPGWLRPLLFFRGLMNAADNKKVLSMMPEAEAAFREEMERLGVEEASAPTGAGGRAARASAG
ncbi:MAG: SDR family oxidoreductase [Thermoleophilaceae bacterium]|nr:SDR family oxidoreductase [Thermoleophilaceae bacterium]